MPIKSKAQRRKFAELLMKGKISEEVYEEWNRGAGDKVLPERLHPKRVAKGKAKRTGKAVKRKTKAAKSRAAPRRKTRKKSTKKTR